MKEKLNKICLIISIVLVIGVLSRYANLLYIVVMTVFYIPKFKNILLLMSTIFLIIGVINIIYLYLVYTMKLFRNNKKIKSITLLIIMIAIFAIMVLLSIKSKFILIQLIYILGVILIPIIMVGVILLNQSIKLKTKVILTTIFVILGIGIYYINYEYLIESARTILENRKEMISFFESEKDGQAVEYNLIYLQNYKEKMDKEGYIDKYDVEQILNIADHRTDDIIVEYYDGENVKEYNNKDNQLKTEIGAILETNYYKFSYEHENGTTKIYIEKYETETSQTTEKNEDIIINGLPNYEITNKIADYINEDDENYLFENEINLENGKETNLDSLRILFVFDNERNNYIPYVENQGELRKIEKYNIYSSGMTITLKDNITLKKKDYTIRVNRYNENIVVDEEQEPYYYYCYEPIATETKNSNGNTVIEFKFNETYKLKNLKNIEIIF